MTEQSGQHLAERHYLEDTATMSTDGGQAAQTRRSGGPCLDCWEPHADRHNEGFPLCLTKAAVLPVESETFHCV